MRTIIIATIKEWNIENYFDLKKRYQQHYYFHLITHKEQLNKNHIEKLNPQYIFFPHWSWFIPEDIFTSYECVVFHMTDLPYGRGGSPVQNLIMNEIYDTKISALRVDGGLDSGDIYIKEDFNISIGSAEEIFIKLSKIIFNKMIPNFLEEKLVPVKQTGKIVEFKRRKPDESNILKLKKKSLNKLYNFIRMLDADGYPKAYIELDDIKIEFSEVSLKSKKLIGRFEVIKGE